MQLLVCSGMDSRVPVSGVGVSLRSVETLHGRWGREMVIMRTTYTQKYMNSPELPNPSEHFTVFVVAQEIIFTSGMPREEAVEANYVVCLFRQSTRSVVTQHTVEIFWIGSINNILTLIWELSSLLPSLCICPKTIQIYI